MKGYDEATSRRSAKRLGYGLLVLLALFWGPSASGQYSLVQKISAQTEDGLLTQLWVSRASVIDGQPIIVNYKVQNRKAKAIYLVWDRRPDITVDRGTITISVPYVVSGGHKEYHYRFIRIPPGKSATGRLEIPPDKYKGSTIWDIQVGFGYVTNIQGLNREPLSAEDPARLMGILGSRLRTFALGYLTVKIY